MKDVNNLVKNLLKYSRRPEWQERLQTTWHEHTEQAARLLQLPEHEIDVFLEDDAWHSQLFGIVFEDFATRQFVGTASFARVYLKQAGWREGTTERKYLEAMADSHLGLYEVLEVKMDKGFMLRDMLQNSTPIFVHEKSATHHIVRWDVLAARVVSVLGEQGLTGGILLLKRDTANELIQVLQQTVNVKSNRQEASLPLLATSWWLRTALDGKKNSLKGLANTDGEAILFGESRLRLLAVPSEITTVLNTSPDWESAGDGSNFWNWLGSEPEKTLQPAASHRIGSHTPSGETIRGTAELKEEYVLFCTNSHERMQRGLLRLKHLLGSKLDAPITSYETVEAVMSKPKKPGNNKNTPGVEPEEVARILADYIDTHYRTTIKSSIPALDNKTPRQAMRSGAGRIKVIEWLKSIENSEARRAEHDGSKPYDITWMWQELGLMEEREK